MTQIFLTSYFTSKPHPQACDQNTIGLDTDGRVINNSFKYIQPWYESLCDLGLCGTVVHDCLSDEFVGKYRNDYISFLRKPNRTSYSNNDFRFIAYYELLKWYDATHLTTPIIHMTDCCDVTINKDPLEFITGNKAYFCRDTMKFSEYTFNAKPVDTLLSYKDLQKFIDYPLLNMGVISMGFYRALTFLFWFNYERTKIESDENLNMPLGNYIIRKHMNNVFTGLPYCTPYKENCSIKDYYFKHK